MDMRFPVYVMYLLKKVLYFSKTGSITLTNGVNLKWWMENKEGLDDQEGHVPATYIGHNEGDHLLIPLTDMPQATAHLDVIIDIELPQQLQEGIQVIGFLDHKDVFKTQQIETVVEMTTEGTWKLVLINPAIHDELHAFMIKKQFEA